MKKETTGIIHTSTQLHIKTSTLQWIENPLCQGTTNLFRLLSYTKTAQEFCQNTFERCTCRKIYVLGWTHFNHHACI